MNPPRLLQPVAPRPTLHLATSRSGSRHADKIKGQWKHIAGKLKQQWSQLTDDDLAVAEGSTEYLAEKIQQRYGVARDEAEKQIREFDIHL